MDDYEPRFFGPDYVPERDHAALMKQNERIKALMLDGQWRTLDEITAATGAPQASASAQLRAFRRPEFGEYTVDRRPRNPGVRGLYEYRVWRPPVVREQVRKPVRIPIRRVTDDPFF